MSMLFIKFSTICMRSKVEVAILTADVLKLQSASFPYFRTPYEEYITHWISSLHFQDLCEQHIFGDTILIAYCSGHPGVETVSNYFI